MVPYECVMIVGLAACFFISGGVWGADGCKESLLLISRVQLIFCKDNANERKESLLLISRMHLIFCKDNANERKESLLLISRMQLIFCKDNER